MTSAPERRRTARVPSGAPLAALLALSCASSLTITSSRQAIPVETEPPGAVARSGDASDASAPAGAAEAAPQQETSRGAATPLPTSEPSTPGRHGKATLLWGALDPRGLELGVRLILPPWEVGASGGQHGQWDTGTHLEGWDVALEAGAGAEDQELRAALLAEVGFTQYEVLAPSSDSSGWGLSGQTSQLREGGSASFPFAGLRATVALRLGRGGWLMLGATGFARFMGSREIPYTVETCTWSIFGPAPCTSDRGVLRAGGQVFGAGLFVGSRFDWNEPAAAP